VARRKGRRESVSTRKGEQPPTPISRERASEPKRTPQDQIDEGSGREGKEVARTTRP
jgi:hypothetical protein